MYVGKLPYAIKSESEDVATVYLFLYVLRSHADVKFDSRPSFQIIMVVWTKSQIKIGSVNWLAMQDLINHDYKCERYICTLVQLDKL